MKKEQSERTINRHYIGVVKEINGSLKHIEVDIPQDCILIYCCPLKDFRMK